MKVSDKRLMKLFGRWYSHHINVEEEHELIQLLQEAKDDGALSEAMEEAYRQLKTAAYFSDEEKQKMVKRVLYGQRRIRYVFSWRKMAAVAAILLFLGTGIYYFVQKNKLHIPEIAKNKALVLDVSPPLTNKAFLRLADGTTIVLNSAAVATLAQQGKVKISKLSDGNIAFRGKSTKITYNTLTLPKGSKPIKLQLADGTKVWLNVASSITFPTAFVGKERRVQMTGEAYFEVAHNAAQPFVVSRGINEVKVLGTHFNIKAYDDMTTMRVTLLEGSVEVNKSITISPGEQAIVQEGRIVLNTHADIQEAMAWKEGRFVFNGATVDVIMKELANWYDVEVMYKSSIPRGHFSGVISRNNKLSQVLKILEAGGLRFKIETKKLIVL